MNNKQKSKKTKGKREVDSLPLKRYLNTGQRSKYYAMETHEGIISKTDYEKVQNLLAKKSITGEIDRTCVFSKNAFAIESSLPTQINP